MIFKLAMAAVRGVGGLAVVVIVGAPLVAFIIGFVKLYLL